MRGTGIDRSDSQGFEPWHQATFQDILIEPMDIEIRIEETEFISWKMTWKVFNKETKGFLKDEEPLRWRKYL